MKPKFTEIYSAQIHPSPIGAIWIAVWENGLLAVQIGENGDNFSQKLAAKFGVPIMPDRFNTKIYTSQIHEYLHGNRKNFDFPIYWEGMSKFQQTALRAVWAVPYGETRTYSQIAAQIGIPRAPRAVGRANATNPMPLAIPCHRLVGADGSLRGYGGGEGIHTKQWLLDLERNR